MPVPKHIKMVFRGDFAGTEEIWSFGLNLTKEKAGSADVTLGEIQDASVKLALATFMNNSLFSAGTRCLEVRCYDIGTDGKMVGEPKYISNSDGSPLSNGTSTNRHPSQVALVVTTRAVNRGPGRLGRFYLPGPAAVVESDWRISATTQTNYLTPTVTFCKAIANSVNASDPLFDVAMVNVSKTGAGALQRVEYISIGRVFDTQRRRRNKLEESRVESGDIDW